MKNKTKRGLSFVIAMIVFMTTLFAGVHGDFFRANAAEDSRVADPGTMDGWKAFFGEDVLSTENAGRIWTDKSVFTSADVFDNEYIKLSDPDNFLVALSAIASNKSIVGYSNLPSDTMLVLDVSNSMSSDNLRAMVQATNDAMRKLYELNNHNRVGIILYSGTAWGGSYPKTSARVLLPLDRYEGVLTRANTYPYRSTENFIGYSNDSVYTLDGVKDSSGDEYDVVSVNASGATYMQSGVYSAWEQFSAVEDTTVDSEWQDGIIRIPVMVLMGDGAPTVGTSSYSNVGSSNYGSGYASDTNNTMTFITQLTCSYVREMMEQKYGREPLFYTLGLGVDNNVYAESVLDPEEYTTERIEAFWNGYLDVADKAGYTFSESNNQGGYGGQGAMTVVRTSVVESKDYVDEYFPAGDAAGLIAAFEAIVNEIVIQSRYYPTEAETGDPNFGGYIEFHDEIGVHMEVTDVKGILIGDDFYSGAEMARQLSDQGTLGTVEEPTDLGKKFIDAVMTRIGLSEFDATELVAAAYSDGQLYYNNNNDYSNYIAWYADDEGNFKGFYSDTDKEPAEGATYVNYSFGYLGTTSGSIRNSDMMYISVQIHKQIGSDHQSVIWKVPAALVPMVSYKIEIEGESVEAGEEISITREAAEPIRLVYEVGLRADINATNVKEKVGTTANEYAYVNDDGSYYFYTNSWSEDTDNHHDHEHTVASFEPSVENEFYYYSIDTPIFEYVNGEYVLIDEEPVTDGTVEYYHSRYIFKRNRNGENYLDIVHEPIRTESLLSYEAEVDENGNVINYYVPMGTIRKVINKIEIAKVDNETETLSFSNHPYIGYPGLGGHDDFHVDTFLGNNGRITVVPAQGIKLAKELEAGLVATDDVFTFEITFKDDVESVVLFDGVEDYETVDVVGNEITVELKAGEEIFIIDIPENVEYVITEVPAEGFAVKSVNGDDTARDFEGTVENQVIEEVVFVNKLAGKGELIVTKSVVSGMENYTVADKVFSVEITLTDASGVAFANEELSCVDSAGAEFTKTTGANGKFVIEISDGRYVIINDIPEGTVYSVNEIDIPDGFTLSEDSTGLYGEILAEENVIAALINEYMPEPLAPNVSVSGTKTLNGRPWNDTDKFTFVLSEFDGTLWNELSSAEVDADNRSYSFTEYFEGITYETIGVYKYRITEKTEDIRGITYDSTSHHFDVFVVDNDSDGRLEISKIMTSQHVAVEFEENEDIWNVTAGFTNTYRPQGTTKVVIDVQKNIDNDTGIEIPLTGFEFGLYNSDDVLVMTSEPTDADGKTSFDLEFDASLAGMTLDFYVKEIEPEEKLPGMQYNHNEFEISIEIVDDLNGGIYANVTKPSRAVSESIEITNVFSLGEIKNAIKANKTLEGRELGNEFSFSLYESNSAFAILDEIENVTNDGNAVGFSEITYTAVGEYYYVIMENDGNALAGVSYDRNVYGAKVTVTSDGNGALLATTEYFLVTESEAVAVESVNFVNYYKPAETTVDVLVSGEKVIDGRDFTESDEFTFVVEKMDDEGQFRPYAEEYVCGIGGNNTFSFPGEIYTEAGTYVYRLFEKSGNEEYMTYDNAVYFIVVDVVDEDAQLVAEITITKDEEPVSSVTFVNVYDEPEPTPTPTVPPTEEPTPTPEEPVIPETSDNSMTMFFMVILFAVCGGVFASTFIRKEDVDN